MQDQQITPSDDAQRPRQLSTPYQHQSTSGTSPQVTPSDESYSNIEKLYIFQETHEVTHFLEENPFLIPLLQEVSIHLKRHFPDSDVVLEVVHDPEITGEKYLVAFILVEIDVEESCEALDRLDQDWELDALLDRAEDRLQIVLEHR